MTNYQLDNITIGEMIAECELHCVVGNNSTYYRCSDCDKRIKAMCKIIQTIADSYDGSFIPACLEITK